MPQIDLLNQEYPSLSTDENQSRLRNMYLEVDEAKGKYKYYALPFPGLTLFCDTGKTAIRAMYEQAGVVYCIADNTLYSISSLGVATSINTLNTSSGFAKMTAIAGGSNTNNQLVIIDGTHGYSYNIGTSTSTFPISDVDFPQTAPDITSLTDVVVVPQLNSITFQASGVSDSLSWDPLDFASKIGQPDPIQAVFAHENKLWLFGSRTTEVWYNSGGALFPFQQMADTFLHYGCAAKQSIVGNENYFIYLSQNERGGYHIVQTLPRLYFYNPQPISTQPIDALINSFSTVSDAVAVQITYLGHEFYIINFPTAGYTLMYDVPPKQQSLGQAGVGAWSVLQSNVSSSYGRWLGNSQAFCYGKNLIGDFNSGKIYYLNSSAYTENSTPIQRQLVSIPLYKEGKRVYVNRLQIDVQTGVGSNKTFTLEKSLDNGSTWSTVNTYTIPDKGGRIFENRLGSSRYGILFRITTTMNAFFSILGFQAEIEFGDS